MSSVRAASPVQGEQPASEKSAEEAAPTMAGMGFAGMALKKGFKGLAKSAVGEADVVDEGPKEESITGMKNGAVSGCTTHCQCDVLTG